MGVRKRVFIIILLILIFWVININQSINHSKYPYNKISLINAEKNGFLKEIEKSDIENDIRLTVNTCIIDKKDCYISFSIYDSKGNKIDIEEVPEIVISNKDGKIRGVGISSSSKSREGIIHFPFQKIDETLDDITIIFKSIKQKVENKNIIHKGEWTISLDLSNYRIPYAEQIYNGFSFNFNDATIDASEIIVFPLSTVIDFDIGQDSSFFNNHELYLNDENGKEYSNFYIHYSEIEKRKRYIYKFESFYFTKPKKLYLCFEPKLEYRTKNKINKYKKEIEIKSIGIK